MVPTWAFFRPHFGVGLAMGLYTKLKAVPGKRVGLENVTFLALLASNLLASDEKIRA